MKIVIVEDEPFFRAAVRSLCQRALDLDVVGETGSASTAIRMIGDLVPDLAILDLTLEDGDGLTVLDTITSAKQCAPRFLILSSHCNPYTVHRCAQVNVHGFVDKHENTESVLCDAIATIARGERYFSPHYLATRLSLVSDPGAFSKVLTDWQQRILRLVTIGCNDDEIATALGISSRTAKTHRAVLLRKLGAKNTPKLMVLARKLGFERSTDVDRPNW